MKTRRLRGRSYRLADGVRVLSVRRPGQLLNSEHAALRRALVATSDAAFGRDTSARWESKLTSESLQRLKRFYLLTGPDGDLIGWSGYRARTINGVRVVYFASTGLLPAYQGKGFVPAIQTRALTYESRRHLTRAVAMAVRTRNPRSYQLARRTFRHGPVVPELDGTVPVQYRLLLAKIANWLDFATLDPTTAIVRDAYADALYERDPRTGDPRVDALFQRLGADDALLLLCLRHNIGS